MSLLGAVLALLLLSGCTWQVAVDASVWWIEPGLFRALPDEGHREGYRFGTLPPNYPTLPFQDEDVTARWGENDHTLRAVRQGDYFLTTNNVARSAVERESQPWMIAYATDTPADPNTIRAGFETFANAVTSADDPTIEEWSQQFMQEKEATYVGWHHNDRVTEWFTVHYVVVDGPFRLPALFADLGGMDAFDDNHAWGHVILRDAAWRWSFSLSGTIGTKEDRGQTFVILTDASDYTQFEREARTTASDEDMAGHLKQAFQELGFGPPSLTDWRFEHITYESGLGDEGRSHGKRGV